MRSTSVARGRFVKICVICGQKNDAQTGIVCAGNEICIVNNRKRTDYGTEKDDNGEVPAH